MYEYSWGSYSPAMLVAARMATIETIKDCMIAFCEMERVSAVEMDRTYSSEEHGETTDAAGNE